MTPEFIIDANEMNFEYEVVAFSKNGANHAKC